ncbi:MAG: N(6)-L-threonylcarbamoyladenine synthase [uncultured Rubrobacteraceae bacterium]|uniref:tRNA N6-adenosine threonylcarbamoyltransferase n=1 Tax=uncultured Rubrobacteraceae bacterium TaxID=349277 RepID=A0A6J4QIN7_9ACTN|nr:MAG: N(6)-L-threonylcarbamoyladenine synthase [uncultured Rubrobacteraceae bacterium]
MILAIETSCDDTCAAVLEPDGRRALSNVVHTQTEHSRYGGVVPEVASRAHLERLDGVVQKALDDADTGLDQIERVAVTVRPGLIGALLVGLSAAKGLAYARRLPLVPVNHLEGHVAAAYLADPTIEPPFVALIASGGHTALYFVTESGMTLLGQTLDDAAGEALDKGARMLGLGFPGGPALSKAARGGDPARYDFPVALKEKNSLDFSFSGLKTSLLYKLKALDEGDIQEELTHLAAGYEGAVVEALTRKLLRAADLHEAPALVVAGGVAANALLRRRLMEEHERRGMKLVIPPPELCTDNAAMIGAAAPNTLAVPFPDYLGLNARSV